MLRALRHLEMHAQPDGREATLEDVAHLLDKPIEKVRSVLGYNERMTSLDAPIDRDAGVSIGEGLADESALAPELVLHNAAIEGWVRLWLDELNERQRTVIERRYGLNGRDVATLEELAREIGVTRERVRQIQAEALEKLRERLQPQGRSTARRCSVVPARPSLPESGAFRPPRCGLRRRRRRPQFRRRGQQVERAFEAPERRRPLERGVGVRGHRPVTQRRVRIADDGERAREFGPARRGAPDVVDRSFVRRARQSGAREPRAHRVPERACAVLAAPAPREPARGSRRPRSPRSR